jgi:predicted enzyme related to lactoylglutathione lyase
MTVTNGSGFTGYELRTTDVDAAEAFYSALFGWSLERAGDARVCWAGDRRVGAITALPERARSMGAPAHWLGSTAVADVDATLRAAIDLGGQPLGPIRPGATLVPIRDAQGAPIALASGEGPAPSDVIVWHQLSTTDREQAWNWYSTLFGWSAGDAPEVAPEIGANQLFTWSGASRPVGGIANTARLPGVHTHWLFYVRVEQLDAATARVAALGGTFANVLTLPSGDRIAHCEDPQRAAFGLYQRA